MKIQIGDKVKFLNSVGGGRVTKIIDKDIVHVLNQDDFEIPVLLKELVKINEDELISGKNENSKSNQKPLSEVFNTKTTNRKETKIDKVEEIIFEEVEEEIFENDNPDLNFYFAIVPKDLRKLGNTTYDLFLINDSNYTVCYNFILIKDSLYHCLKSDIIEPNTKIMLESYEADQITKHTDYIIQVIASKKDLYPPLLPFHKEINLRPVKLFKESSFKENDFFDEKALLFTVVEENRLVNEMDKLNKETFNRIVKEKEDGSKNITKPKVYKISDSDELEVDLHLHNLIDNENGLSNQDKLDIQLKAFRENLDEAIKKQLRRVVFIHGIGNGTLKLELRRELDSKYKKYQYQDASFKEYGFGATMVLLRK